jgi:hypothetical protein
MIGRGSGASHFSVGDTVRLLVDKNWVGAKVVASTFFGVTFETKTRVEGRVLIRTQFVAKGALAEKVRVLRPVPGEESQA